MDALADRLEKVTSRLEALAKKGFGKGGGGDDDEDGTPAFVTDFDQICANQMEAACAAADQVGAKDIRGLMSSGFKCIARFLLASSKCKKPPQPDMMAFLADAVGAISSAEKLKFKRNKWENHHAAFYELIVGSSWVTMSPPYGLPLEHVKAQKDATQFHLNRILKKYKDSAEKDKHKVFVKAFNDLGQAQIDFVKEYFKTGLDWNPQGIELSAYMTGAGAAAPAKAETPAKPAPKKKAAPAKAGGGGGALNVFAELKKKADGGDSAAKGMKKVTKDMKTKYRKDRGGLVKAPVKAAPKKKGPGKPKSMQNMGGRWMTQYYYQEPTPVEFKDVKVRDNIFLTVCEESVFVINDKVKGVTLDSCKKVRVYCSDVVSVVEMVNCKSCTVYLRGKTPSVQIDKCTSPKIVIMKEAMNPLPKIITSNISAGNVEMPDPNNPEDTIETPMPEQYENTIDPKTGAITSAPVSHG